MFRTLTNGFYSKTRPSYYSYKFSNLFTNTVSVTKESKELKISVRANKKVEEDLTVHWSADQEFF